MSRRCRACAWDQGGDWRIVAVSRGVRHDRGTSAGHARRTSRSILEYGPLDKLNKLKAIDDMASVMYPDLQDIDFRTQVPSARRAGVPRPEGAGDGAPSFARAEPTREWFDQLDAPSKEWIALENSGHVPQFEEFPTFRDVVADVVETSG